MLIPKKQKVRPPDSYEITASHAACPLPVHRCIGLMQKPVKYSINKTAQTSKAILRCKLPHSCEAVSLQNIHTNLKNTLTCKLPYSYKSHCNIYTKNTLTSSAIFTQSYHRSACSIFHHMCRNLAAINLTIRTRTPSNISKHSFPYVDQQVFGMLLLLNSIIILLLNVCLRY